MEQRTGKEKEKVNSPEYWDDRFNSIRTRVDMIGFDMLVGHIKPNDRVLDFGCGRGEWLKHISEVEPTAKLFGSDISSVACSTTMREVPGCAWSDDITIYEDFFDVITTLHTIEHFKDPVAQIKVFEKCLKKDGLLIIVLPYHDRIWPEHYKIWGKAEVEDLLNNFNCDVRLMIRNPTFLDNGKIILKHYPDGHIFREIICLVRFKEDK